MNLLCRIDLDTMNCMLFIIEIENDKGVNSVITYNVYKL